MTRRMEYLTVGQLAVRAGVKKSTLRFYERRGLLSPSARSPSGYRLYTPDAVATVKFIRRAQGLGFSLEEIAELLALRRTSSLSRDQVRRLAIEKIREIGERIAVLQALKGALEELLAACGRSEDTRGCPILSVLEGKGEGGERR